MKGLWLEHRGRAPESLGVYTWSDLSNRDFHQYGSALKYFEGRTFDMTFATNSIKLMFNPQSHRDRYVWIDPLWTVESAGGEVVASGGDYPDPTEADYEQKHQSWCARVAALLDGARLESVSCSADGKVKLGLSGDRCLVLLPMGVAPGPDEWYDDWYVKLDDA
jgi:hypothetical protein